MNIHCLNSISQEGLKHLGKNYNIVDSIDTADAILVRSAAMHDMQIPESVLCVARAGAGVNNIPIEEYSKRGIVVFNTPGANANGVKELVLCGMLIAARDVIGGTEWVQSISDHEGIEKDVEKGKKAFAGSEIRGKKLGVIGLGAIGGQVAAAAISLGMEVLGYDPFISINAAWMLSNQIERVIDLERIYRECDYITLHVPFTKENEGMICKQTLDMMKDGVVVLNMARGALVNDDDMAAALSSGKVKRYVTDFPDTKTSSMEGCIAIPHLGASTQESEENCAVMAVRETMEYLKYGTISNSVNFPTCDIGKCQSAQRLVILNKNVPNMLGQITSVVAEEGVNIANLMNKSREAYACTILDLETPARDDCIEKIAAIDGVLRVRVI